MSIWHCNVICFYSWWMETQTNPAMNTCCNLLARLSFCDLTDVLQMLKTFLLFHVTVLAVHTSAIMCTTHSLTFVRTAKTYRSSCTCWKQDHVHSKNGISQKSMHLSLQGRSAFRLVLSAALFYLLLRWLSLSVCSGVTGTVLDFCEKKPLRTWFGTTLGEKQVCQTHCVSPLSLTSHWFPELKCHEAQTAQKCCFRHVVYMHPRFNRNTCAGYRSEETHPSQIPFSSFFTYTVFSNDPDKLL